MIYESYLQRAQSEKKRIEKLVVKLKQMNTRKVDEFFHTLHDEAFEKIDCLKCANCCKTTSPLFRNIDIERLSKHLKIKEQHFTETYLKIDEDGDYVFKSAPCPFLMDDNYCSVYESRPNACREYPHTNRKKMQQILKLTATNAQICPAVAEIFQGIFAKLKI
ncbi:MAG: YkgJ family cysteine cluster protein [Bacteroidia bacterium]